MLTLKTSQILEPFGLSMYKLHRNVYLSGKTQQFYVESIAIETYDSCS
jgi:hypothetical protein